MKATNCLFMILTVGALALAGCGKSREQAPAHRPGAIDLGQLQQAFPAPTPEIQSSLDKLRFSVRYRSFQTGLAELDKLARLPGLTEPQKKAVNDVIQQIKEAIKTVPAAPSQ